MRGSAERLVSFRRNVLHRFHAAIRSINCGPSFRTFPIAFRREKSQMLAWRRGEHHGLSSHAPVGTASIIVISSTLGRPTVMENTRNGPVWHPRSKMRWHNAASARKSEVTVQRGLLVQSFSDELQGKQNGIHAPQQLFDAEVRVRPLPARRNVEDTAGAGPDVRGASRATRTLQKSAAFHG
jgi:hypothetical protein